MGGTSGNSELNSRDLAGLESLPWHVLDSFHEGCQVIEFDGTYLYLNEAAAFQGRDPAVGAAAGSQGALHVGVHDDAIVHHGVLDPGIHFISKPFSAAGLARKVREVLDA
jgi:hypothetical protein